MRFGVTIKRIMAANSDINPNNLQVGQIICIPARFAIGCPGIFYGILSGDTIASLARRFNTSVNYILSFNPVIDTNNLQVGLAICIPVTGSCQTGTFPYTIKKGDTYSIIAIRFAATITAISNTNPGVDLNNLQVGQTICVPSVTP